MLFHHLESLLVCLTDVKCRIVVIKYKTKLTNVLPMCSYHVHKKANLLLLAWKLTHILLFCKGYILLSWHRQPMLKSYYISIGCPTNVQQLSIVVFNSARVNDVNTRPLLSFSVLLFEGRHSICWICNSVYNLVHSCIKFNFFCQLCNSVECILIYY